MTKNKKSFWKKLIIAFLIIFLIGFAYVGYRVYRIVYETNVNLGYKKNVYLYIPTGSTYEDVRELLIKENIIINMRSFEWLAHKKSYELNVKPGKYKITSGMSNNDIVNMLRSGNQEPVKLKFNNIRTKEQLASKISKQIEADSISIITLLNDNSYIQKYKFNKDNVLALFIPNTYEIFWNTSAPQFFTRMNKEYLAFWDASKIEKAKNIGLTQIEVSILASIVQSETSKPKEMPIVAGVYINRLRKDMLLQADPTVIYALGDFTIKRVYKKHLEIDSPYNTYKYLGLPPGPITLPEIITLEKVLNYQKHDYIFFCAKDDLSGYHNFAKTNAQHEENARRYQNALNLRKIK